MDDLNDLVDVIHSHTDIIGKLVDLEYDRATNNINNTIMTNQLTTTTNENKN